jgi:hypothetical protein
MDLLSLRLRGSSCLYVIASTSMREKYLHALAVTPKIASPIYSGWDWLNYCGGCREDALTNATPEVFQG